MNKSNNIDKLIKVAKSGDIICVRTNGFMPRALICWWTNSYYNHTANYIGNGKIIDSTLEHGVIERDVSDLGIFEWSILRPNKPFNKKVLINSLKKYVGRKYDVMGILGFFLPFIKSGSRALFCSELTSTVYNEAGYKLVARTATDKVSPETVYQSMALDEIAASDEYGAFKMIKK